MDDRDDRLKVVLDRPMARDGHARRRPQLAYRGAVLVRKVSEDPRCRAVLLHGLEDITNLAFGAAEDLGNIVAMDIRIRMRLVMVLGFFLGESAGEREFSQQEIGGRGERGGWMLAKRLLDSTLR